jgi:hypothetical protein
MYRCLLAEHPGKSAVILGHHQDDVDENRLVPRCLIADKNHAAYPLVN